MKKNKQTDMYERIKRFQQKTLSAKPTREEMINEVRMMNFKVKPVFGNVTQIDFTNTDFIESLWSLGKLDEFFRNEYPTIKEDDKEIFFRLVDEMRANLQQRLNTSYIVTTNTETDRTVFEVEIFKEVTSRVN